MSAFTYIRNRLTPDRNTPYVLWEFALAATAGYAFTRNPSAGVMVASFLIYTKRTEPKPEVIDAMFRYDKRMMEDYVPPSSLERKILIGGAIAGAFLPIAVKLSGFESMTIIPIDNSSPTVEAYDWGTARGLSGLGFIFGGGAASMIYHGAKDITAATRKLSGRVRNRWHRHMSGPS